VGDVLRLTDCVRRADQFHCHGLELTVRLIMLLITTLWRNEMAKSTVTEQPKAVDALVGITEQAIAVRYTDRTPTLSDLVRVVSTASRLLRYDNLDERIEVENAAVLALAKKRQLVS
jgi:hypothetical protein